MSEKRKPDFVFLLRKSGKKANKIELFNSKKFDDKNWSYRGGQKYRVRVNGRWHDTRKDVTKKYYTKWEIRDLIWRSIPI